MKRLYTLLAYILLCHVPFLKAQHLVLTPQIGHSSKITCLEYAEKYLLSGSFDNTIKLWDRKSGRLIRTFRGHSNAITDISMQNDSLFVSSSLDGTLNLWNLNTGEIINTYSGHAKGVSACGFSPNGKILFSADWDGKILLHDYQSGKLLKILETNNGVITGLSLSGDGTRVFSAGSDGRITAMNVPEGTVSYTIEAHKGGVKQLVFDSEKKKMASIGNDKRIKIWNTDNGEIIHNVKFAWNLELAPQQFNDIAFSADDEFIIAATDDNRIAFWDTETGNSVKLINTDMTNISAITADRTSRIIAVANNKTIEFWDSRNGEKRLELSGESRAVKSLDVSSDNRFLSIGCEEQALVWNLITGKIVSQPIEKQNNKDVIFNPQESSELALAGKNTIEVYNFIQNQKKKSVSRQGNIFTALDFRIDGKYLASGNFGGIVQYWEIVPKERDEMMRTFHGHKGAVFDVKVSPNGKYIASAGKDRTVKIWDIENNRLHKTLVAHTDEVWSVAFSNNGHFLASGGCDKNVIIWDTKNWEVVHRMTGHRDYVKDLCFSADDNIVASASWDNTIKIWNPVSGELLRTLTGHSNYVQTLAFSANNAFLYSGGNDNQVKVWNLLSGRELLSLMVFPNGRDYVITTPKGFFDGTSEAINSGLHFVQNNKVISLDAFFEQFYVPDLWNIVMAGDSISSPGIDISKPVQFPPELSIHFKDNKKHKIRKFDELWHTSANSIKLEVEAKIYSGGIEDIRLYHNGKWLQNKQRGFKAVKNNAKNYTYTYQVELLPGINSFKAKAFSNHRISTSSPELNIVRDAAEAKSNLHLFVIGVNRYENEMYRLNYAKNDADEFQRLINQNAKDMFDDIQTYFLYDSLTTKNSVNQVFNAIQETIRPEDVFIFYFAGHGVTAMHDFTSPEFYLLPYNITQMYGDENQLQEKAISTGELLAFSRSIEARKQLFIIDACQSGSAVEGFSTRGIEQQRAVVQLARSAGIALITSSSNEQASSEAKELEHGIFTYALLEGLKGKADGSSFDKKITVNELKAYLDQRVPELSQKFHSVSQYPTAYIKGQDFPLILVK